MSTAAASYNKINSLDQLTIRNMDLTDLRDLKESIEFALDRTENRIKNQLRNPFNDQHKREAITKLVEAKTKGQKLLQLIGERIGT